MEVIFGACRACALGVRQVWLGVGPESGISLPISRLKWKSLGAKAE